jgi:hypothetical protein
MEYYKKVDKSVLHNGITILTRHVNDFMFNQPLKPGEYRPIKLTWKNKSFDARVGRLDRKKATATYHIRWDNNGELLLELRKEFIQTFLAVESANYTANVSGKYFRTSLEGGNQEVLIFRPVSANEVELETFIRIPTPYDNIFRRLVEENVFGWLSKERKEYVVTKATPWLDIAELPKHQDASFVIYYLIDEEQQEIYIGSAKRLGDRVKPRRVEIPGWTKFKYEIIHPQYHHLLRELEHHSIRAFSGFFENKGKMPFYQVSSFRLANKNWSRRK